ncbi:MPN555 family protein chaperone [Mycoplasma parvum]|uniref:Trigger factor C-terminal domain-containing protein n=1 Tax=Mycoplasma parvum str. Indiana TaxID=1403316 RepID=U5NC62_9MOLU|nr:hypothetical protein [Mycoplasma parvum]AGX89166.1 hypothetical protein PRV_02140 [Mycoplasma parvum str. Indiana]
MQEKLVSKPSFKSKVKRNRAINWGSLVVVNEIKTLPHLVENFEQALKAANPGITKKELEEKKKEVILKDNIFNCVMDEVASAYSIEFDEEEVKEKEKKFLEQFQGFSADEIRSNVKVMILKELIYEDLAKEWGLEVSLDVARDVLKDFLSKTGQSYSEYLNDPDRIEMVRKSILEQTITTRIINGFETKIQLGDNSGRVVKQKMLKS